MYTRKDSGVITELKCGNNFEYILEDNTHFLNTDYKVLQSQTDGVLIPCMKMMRNGKTALYYITDGYRTISSMCSGITADLLRIILINLFSSVLEVKNNGFLTCQGIDLSWDKIFVEQSTWKVKLIYLPFGAKVFDSYAEFENELRSGIIKLIHNVIFSVDEGTNQLINYLCNGSMTLEDVYRKARNISKVSVSSPDTNTQIDNSGRMDKPGQMMKLVAMNAPVHFEIVVNKDSLLIGKKKELVDVTIAFNNMISRKHCKITKVNGEYYISDEGSANGTYVNQVRLAPRQSCRINKGDMIRLANSDFQVM